MEVTAVCLQMDYTTRFKETAVTVHEDRRCQTLLLPADLRVGKGNPDFSHLVLSKKGGYEFYAGPEKSHIGKAVFLSVLGAFPKAAKWLGRMGQEIFQKSYLTNITTESPLYRALSLLHTKPMGISQ